MEDINEMRYRYVDRTGQDRTAQHSTAQDRIGWDKLCRLKDVVDSRVMRGRYGADMSSPEWMRLTWEAALMMGRRSEKIRMGCVTVRRSYM
ncbi:MAG: hypothetical protein K0Q73_2017 [Paenibacillus sp.]|jgi:hypothetical protein|nr:hypothetical protein [Paenibacillus sp.]